MSSFEAIEAIRKKYKEAHPELDATVPALTAAIDLVNQQVSEVFAEQFAQAGIHESGFEVLNALHGVTGEGVTLSTLAQQMHVTPASITNRVEQLLKKGLISKETNPKDKRVSFVKITKSGSKLVEKLKPALIQAEQNAFGEFKKGDRKDLLKLLEKLSDTLGPK